LKVRKLEIISISFIILQASELQALSASDQKSQINSEHVCTKFIVKQKNVWPRNPLTVRR